ncbi:MAG: sodium:solute symporter family protein [Bacteriovoracaceae bacterium]
MISQNTLYQFLSPLDWILFVLVLFLTFLAILYGQRLKNKLSEKDQHSPLELLLMGRRLTLPLFVATLVATWYGGIFGVTTLTYEKGIYNFITQGVFWYISYLIFALVLVKRIKKYSAFSLPDLAGQMIGEKAGKITAILNFLNLLPMAYVISLGLFLQALFGGNLFVNSGIGIFIVVSYSLWGGFRAVVFSDIVQFFFMVLSVFLVVFFAWMNLGSPWELMEKLPPTHLSPTGGEHLSVLLVWGFIALSTLVDPNFYQRCLAAKDEKTARNGIFLSIIFWIFIDCCTTLGALYARVYLPEANPQNAYLQFAIQLLPSGFKGIMLAGILATILSTLDSFLFMASTCLSYDMLTIKNKFKSWHHHLALILISIISLLFSFLFEGNVVSVWKTLGGFSAATLLIPLIIAQLFPSKVKESDFIWSVSLGCIGIVSWKVLTHWRYITSELDEFYIGLALSTLPLLCAILKRGLLSKRCQN